MPNRDERRNQLRQRLTAAFRTDAPQHAFRESAAYPGTCLCGMTSIHPVHEPAAVIEGSQENTGVMIALFPSLALAQQLALKGGEKADQLHVTLAYLGDKSNVPDMDGLINLISQFAKGYTDSIKGEVSGLGIFSNPTGAVTYASVDLPTLPSFRQALVEMLDTNGYTVAKDHGYTPHMTLAYDDRRNTKIGNTPIEFDAITVCAGDFRVSFPLATPVEESAEKKKKHHYISPGIIGGGAIYYGGGLAPCAACGEPREADCHDDGAPEVPDGGGAAQPAAGPAVGMDARLRSH
jgi:2'-5' RNA ligase